MKPDYKTKLA